MSDSFYEPSAENRETANTVYDMYQSYIWAGFSEEQAMQIILTAVSSALNNN